MWMSASPFKICIGASLVAISIVLVAFYTETERRKRKKTQIINMMEECRNPNVHMKDPDHVEELINLFIQEGKDRLQIVSDFDKTLSKHMHNGIRVPSCHGVIDTSETLPESYREEATKLRNKYYPIEMSTTITLEDKYKSMVEWWNTAHDLLIKCNLTKDKVAEIVATNLIQLRDGANQLLEQLHTHNVPILIFSAGVGDILKETIKQRAQFFDNIHVISNFMDFDSEGNLIGFKGDLIHTFNKHEVAVHHPEVFEANKERTNIILMGDTLGDLTMADGIMYRKNVLTIGYLNDHLSENLEEYKKRYDIVLVDEDSVRLVNGFLDKILNGDEK